MSLFQFPADRRLAHVKRCAETLMRTHGAEADRFWRGEMRTLRASLERSGADEAEISHQGTLFMQAVQMELQTRHAQDLTAVVG